NLPLVSVAQPLLGASVLATHQASRTCVMLGGAVKCWGLNAFGALGLGDVASRGGNPNEMGNNLAYVNLQDPVGGYLPPNLATGGNHGCALFGNGQIKCWGANNSGQLGQGNTSAIGDQPDEVKNIPFINLGTNGTATKMALGFAHTCALLAGGKVKCWGA